MKISRKNLSGTEGRHPRLLNGNPISKCVGMPGTKQVVLIADPYNVTLTFEEIELAWETIQKARSSHSISPVILPFGRT